MKKVFLIGLPLLLASCASAPTSEQMQNADYGTYTSPETCIKLTESALSTLLKDPGSAQWNHNTCGPGWAGSVPLMGISAAFGYRQTGTVNAKNSYGGYTGFSSYQVLIKNGAVIRKCITNRDGLCLFS